MGIKMNIEGFRFRVSDGQMRTADQLRVVQQRLAGIAGMQRIRAGDNPEILAGYLAMRGPVAGVKVELVNVAAQLTAVSGGIGIEIPEMIDISEGKKIMKDEVTVDLFKQVMEGYERIGHNADKLESLLADHEKAQKPLTYVNLLDGREFAKRLSELTGRKFRIQTEAEWLEAAGKLEGDNWTWTETKYDEETCVLRLRGTGYRSFYHPGHRYYNYSLRLVEDLK